MSTPNGHIFRDMPNVYAISGLAENLECIARTNGIRLTAKSREEEAVPIIRQILSDIVPEAFSEARKIDARVIWGIYWRMQNDPRFKHVIFLDLLRMLDKNKSSPFAAIFA